jgi:tetratricopeptide (TPR) repeat protein
MVADPFTRILLCSTPVLSAALLATLGYGLVAARQIESPDALHTAYLTEGRAALLRTFSNATAYVERRQELSRAARTWRDNWTPSRTAMLLEIAALAIERQWPNGKTLLLDSAGLMVERPGRPGSDEATDAFERTFHRVSIAALTAGGLLQDADDYIERVSSRVSAAPGRDDRIFDPHLALARALVADARTALVLTVAPNPSGLPSLSDPPADIRRALEVADRAYQAASRLPEVAVEARIRRAFVVHRLGLHAQALTLLDETASADLSADPDLAYWVGLVRGRVLEHLGRDDEAREPYERATALRPQAQTALIVLASWFERHGQPAQAEGWAARARGLPPNAADPWWAYWLGDVRRMPGWLAELRSARP